MLVQIQRWWIKLLFPFFQKLLPPWQVSVTLFTLLSIWYNDPFLSTTVGIFWASFLFALLYRRLSRYVGRSKWPFVAYHAVLSLSIANPTYAQLNGVASGACSTSGLFSSVTNYVSQLFSTVSFGGVGGGTLGGLICQVVGFLTITLVLAFLGVFGYVSYQIGYNKQPVSTALDPLMGFLIFAGAASVVIGVMIGTSAT
ncbi:hypothetical protein B7486_48205 [cyanobacterium TDX16]|nr:hypothetical protein B7486_48205 [cyanobacterium TDX16]